MCQAPSGTGWTDGAKLSVALWTQPDVTPAILGHNHQDHPSVIWVHFSCSFPVDYK